jgi:anti-sigma-K factor RskA
MSANLHAMTGAYAAHALSGTERAAFERHLADCPACAREVGSLEAATARLGTAGATPPPPELWDRTGPRPWPPASYRRLPVGPSAPRVGASWAGGGAGPGRRRFPPLLAAAAALLVAVLGDRPQPGPAGTVGPVGSDRRPGAAVLAAPDARRVAAMPGGPGQATVVVSRQRGHAVFVASGLPPAPADRTYQLWVVNRSGPRPAGLVEAGGGGRVTRLLDGTVTGNEQVAMTVERPGGAARPTSEPVVVVDLRA